ncbi:hypothetical protein Tco_1050956 [Tanacetum coccineum]
MCSLEIYLDLRHMKIIKICGSMNGIKKSHRLKKNHGWMMELGMNLMMIHVMNAIHFNSGVDILNGLLGKKEEEESSENAWSNYLPNDDNDAIQATQERFDNHEPMEDDDDIGDLDDYLIQNDAS